MLRKMFKREMEIEWRCRGYRGEGRVCNVGKGKRRYMRLGK